MLSFMFLLFVQISSEDISFEEYYCSNISPNNKGCNQLAKEGQCDILDAQYCRLSCKTCCVDMEREGTTCDDVVEINGCDIFVESGYCLRSCNACHRLMEIYALNSLKSAIQFPDQLSTWTGWDPCDNWLSVSCQNDSVSELILHNNVRNAAATIPVQLSCLEDSNILDIWATGFSGRLPPEFSALTSMTEVDFDALSLSGSLPPLYSTWSQISTFHVTQNAITSSIPRQFSTWTQLNNFGLTSNQLTGSLPLEFSTWSDIKTIYINHNQLTGEVPLQMSAWTQIQDFDARHENDLCVPNDFYGSAIIVRECPNIC